MRAVLCGTVGVLCWAAALLGTLYIHRLDLRLGHSICGRWGCGPPTEALIGFHCFWLVLLAPVVAGTLWWLPHSRRGEACRWLLAVGAMLTVGWGCWDAVAYCLRVGSWQHVVPRAAFAVVTQVDLPLMQLFVLGAAGLGVLKMTQRKTPISI